MDKFFTLADAVADIPDGATLTLGGFGYAHNYPTTLIDALASSGRRDLWPVANSLGTGPQPPERLVANRQVRKLIVSFSSRPGVKSPVEEQAAAGERELEMVSRGDQILSGR
jgi:3-oxoacid CoA-transferase